ncbi:MAG TPA: hypothetical protein VF186_09390 [Gaiellaceae bacterium]
MTLVQQWRELQADLPPDWATAQLRLALADAETTGRAASLLGPAQPVRPQSGVLRFAAARGGAAPGPEAVARLLERLDREGVGGTLELVGSPRTAVAVAPVPEAPLAEAWSAELAKLPADWSDLYGEVELLSTDYFERASVLCTPMNPRRDGRRAAFRFRCARRFGYGTSPEMVRRCLERCDAESLRGSVTVLRALSDTHPVATQGPVWLLDGRTV